MKEIDGYRYINTSVDYISLLRQSYFKKTVESVVKFLYKLQCQYGLHDIHITDKGK